MKRLEGKVAIITGGASGIGAETAFTLAKHGAKVVVADFNEAGAKKMAERITAEGGIASHVFVNATQEESVKNMVDHAVKMFGKLDILHNNAGGSKPSDGDIASMTQDTWDFAIGLNLNAVLWGCKYGVLAMRENGGGSIINTASMSGLLGDHTYSAYGIAKAGVVNLTKYVATQEGKNYIRCNAIAPSVVETPATQAVFSDEVRNAYLKTNAVPRLGQPSDIAHAVLFLASDESGYMTGHTLLLDGGAMAHQPNLF